MVVVVSGAAARWREELERTPQERKPKWEV